jgi:hypothetical protein
MAAGELSYAGHHRIIVWAVEKALGVPAERSLNVLLDGIKRGLLEQQPPVTVDGWARLAMSEGARKAWSGLENDAPPDAPGGAAGAVYVVVQTASYAYTLAAKKAGQHAR